MAAAARRRAWLRLARDLLAAVRRVDLAGVFDRLHLELLDRLGRRGLLDWSRAAIDTYSLRAKRGGGHVGANPVDRGKPGSKLHLVIDALGVPLAAAVTAANVHDSVPFEAMLDDLPPIRTPAGQRRCRPAKLHADKAYDLPRCRAYLRRRGITARIARRGVESSTRLGRHRWRVERSLSWLSCYRRLQVRWDRCSGRFFAFVLLACALVCLKQLNAHPMGRHRADPWE